MFKKVVLVILLAIASLLIYAAFKDSHYRISREIVIKADIAKLFPYINNSQKTNEWMPWAEMDPQMKMTYSGPAEGFGSAAHWESAGPMGVGQSEVIESLLNDKVTTKLKYEKPRAMEQLAEMSLSAVEGGTLVRWSVEGTNDFMGRLVCVFINMDQMVGDMFSKGLNKFKTLMEEGK